MRRAILISRSRWSAGSLEAASISSDSSGDKVLSLGQDAGASGLSTVMQLVLVSLVLFSDFISVPRFLIIFKVSVVSTGNAFVNSIIHGGRKENVKYYCNDKLQHLFPGTLRGVKAQ